MSVSAILFQSDESRLKRNSKTAGQKTSMKDEKCSGGQCKQRGRIVDRNQDTPIVKEKTHSVFKLMRKKKKGYE